jgi:hypothetical protein
MGHSRTMAHTRHAGAGPEARPWSLYSSEDTRAVRLSRRNQESAPAPPRGALCCAGPNSFASPITLASFIAGERSRSACASQHWPKNAGPDRVPTADFGVLSEARCSRDSKSLVPHWYLGPLKEEMPANHKTIKPPICRYSMRGERGDSNPRPPGPQPAGSRVVGAQRPMFTGFSASQCR